MSRVIVAIPSCVGRDFAPQQLGALLGHERPADRCENVPGRGITHAGLDRRLPRGDLQFEQLDQPQPGRKGNPRLPDPVADFNSIIMVIQS